MIKIGALSQLLGSQAIIISFPLLLTQTAFLWVELEGGGIEKEKKERELMDTENSVVIVVLREGGKRGLGESGRGYRVINVDGKNKIYIKK